MKRSANSTPIIHKFNEKADNNPSQILQELDNALENLYESNNSFCKVKEYILYTDKAATNPYLLGDIQILDF